MSVRILDKVVDFTDDGIISLEDELEVTTGSSASCLLSPSFFTEGGIYQITLFTSIDRENNRFTDLGSICIKSVDPVIDWRQPDYTERVAALRECVDEVQRGLRPERVDIRIFPNPTEGQIKIFIPIRRETVNYQIYSAQGKRIQMGKTNDNLDLSHLAKGVYYLRVSSQNNRYYGIDKIAIL